MAKSVCIVYRTDVWHTHESKELWGVFTSEKKAIATLKKNFELSSDDVYNLRQIRQTQSDGESKFEGEFVLENYTLNAID